MHDYTARIIHDDRMAELVREADAARLASRARGGRSRTNLVERVRMRLASLRRRQDAQPSGRRADLAASADTKL
jgi:hypothetical protein